MKLFRRKSRWDRLVEPVSHLSPTKTIKSGLTAVGAVVGVSVASAVVSAVRAKSSDS